MAFTFPGARVDGAGRDCVLLTMQCCGTEYSLVCSLGCSLVWSRTAPTMTHWLLCSFLWARA